MEEQNIPNEDGSQKAGHPTPNNSTTIELIRHPLDEGARHDKMCDIFFDKNWWYKLVGAGLLLVGGLLCMFIPVLGWIISIPIFYYGYRYVKVEPTYWLKHFRKNKEGEYKEIESQAILELSNTYLNFRCPKCKHNAAVISIPADDEEFSCPQCSMVFGRNDNILTLPQ